MCDANTITDPNGVSTWGNPEEEYASTVELGRLATLALYEEDRSLFAAMKGGAGTRFAKESAGLTYWLYETTMVYFIFKAWAARFYVRWDWEPAPPRNASRRVGLLDMAVAIGQDEPNLAFEAKWWNNAKGELSMSEDAKRLQAWVAQQAGRRGFLMAFWWSDANQIDADMRKATAHPVAKGWTHVFRGSFLTNRAQNDTTRRFFIEIIKV